MPLPNPFLEAALEVLRATKHDVGETTIKDGVMYVSVDGAPRTYEEIFQMVEEYANKTYNRKAAS